LHNASKGLWRYLRPTVRIALHAAPIGRGTGCEQRGSQHSAR